MDPKKANELVFGFDEKLMYGFTRLFSDAGGLCNSKLDHNWFNVCCERSYLMPRKLIEGDPGFKQIIPYIVLRSADQFFAYRREGAEGRLTGKYSIGIGGHLNPVDYLGVLSQVPKNGAKREFWEELYLEKGLTSDYMFIDSVFDSKANPYYLYDPSDSVGRVHFGVVYIIRMNQDTSEKIRLANEGTNASWKTMEELKSLDDELEGWSRLVVNACL